MLLPAAAPVLVATTLPDEDVAVVAVQVVVLVSACAAVCSAVSEVLTAW